MIYTFYSYKGGVGRTMALANVAELFYQNGLNVLMVDWDLEAPGLERFFFSTQELPKVLDKPGLMDMILQYKTQMARELEADAPLELENPAQYIIGVYPNQTGPGKLFLLTAGRRSKPHFAAYAESVLTFNWQEFYEKWDGEIYFEWLREQFENIADVILIDSRTGVTEMGGVCTYQMADVVVMLCAPNRQNLEGTYEMASNFTSPRVQELRTDRPLNLLVVPARIERAESELLDRFQKNFIDSFKDSVSPITTVQELWRLNIPYIPKYAFTETIAVRESSRASAGDMASAFHALYEVMIRLVPEPLFKKLFSKPIPQKYNLNNIRTLLVEAFTDEELRRLCYDIPDFRSVYDQLASGSGKVGIVDRIIEYAERRLQLETLLDLAKKYNLARYENHGPYVMPQPLHVFLCHASTDKPHVRSLSRRLQNDGFQPWLDEEELLPGEDWRLEIPNAVRSADVVLVCLSNNSITKSGHIQKEIKFVLDITDEQPEGTIFLIPLRLEPCDVPERLSRWHWANLFEPKGYDRLIKALRSRAEAIAKS